MTAGNGSRQPAVQVRCAIYVPVRCADAAALEPEPLFKADYSVRPEGFESRSYFRRAAPSAHVPSHRGLTVLDLVRQLIPRSMYVTGSTRATGWAYVTGAM
jgi:hypothetical protein